MSSGNNRSYLAAGGKLTAPDNATPRYRGEVMRQMAILIDSLLAGAAGFADCINLAPGLKERITAAGIVRDKFTHAWRILGLMDQFGANGAQYVNAHCWAARRDRSVYLGTRRIEGDMRLNVFHYPIQGWVDSVVLNTLMGAATVIQLKELAHCSYAPLAEALVAILPREARHAELGRRGLTALLAGGSARIDGQAAVNYWYQRVADTFGRANSDRFETHRKLGLRHHPNEELRRRWRNEIDLLVTGLGLQVPEIAQERNVALTGIG